MFCMRIDEYLKNVNEKDVRYYSKEDSILFNSKGDNFVMSNMYPCRLVYEGITFHSVEQLYFWMLYSENKKMQDKILSFNGICNAFDVKKFCKEHINERDKDYELKKYRCLGKCLELKYKQCEEFREAINESADKQLVELAPWDAEFGAMWIKEHNAYVGKNACGRMMMNVRNRYCKV